MWRKNLLFIIAVVLVSQFLVHLPDYLRWKNTPSDLWFTGQVSWFDPWDQNVYFSAIGWGRRAGLVFQNLYDAQSEKPIQIYGVYTALGRIFSALPVSNAAIFHISVIFLNFILAVVVWWFLQIFLPKNIDRKVSFVLIFLGAGLGWLFFPGIVLPDLGQPGFMFESATRRPHEAVSIGFFLLTIGTLWKGGFGKRKLYLILAGFSSFIAFYFHPYSVLTLGGMFVSFGIYSLFNESGWGQLFKNPLKTPFGQVMLTFGVSGSLYMLAFGLQMLKDPSSSGLVGQIQYSPNPIYAVLGWGILFPFVLITLITPIEDRKINFLKLWFISQFLIIYIPLGFQKLLIRGLWVVVVMLAILGVEIIATKFKLRQGVLLVFILLFVCIGNLFIFANKVSEPNTNRWINLSNGEKEIVDFLYDNGQKEEGVLASYRVANIIPANTNKRVYAGHEFQTPDFKSRIAEVNKFYEGQMTDQEAKDFFKKARVVWVFWGPDEKAIGYLENIPNNGLFDTILQTGKASLYKIK